MLYWQYGWIPLGWSLKVWVDSRNSTVPPFQDANHGHHNDCEQDSVAHAWTY